jgi:hypothetical protein
MAGRPLLDIFIILVNCWYLVLYGIYRKKIIKKLEKNLTGVSA